MKIIAVSQVKYLLTLPRFSKSFVATRSATPRTIKNNPMLILG